MGYENGEAAEDDKKLKGCEHRVAESVGWGASRVNFDAKG